MTVHNSFSVTVTSGRYYYSFGEILDSKEIFLSVFEREEQIIFLFHIISCDLIYLTCFLFVFAGSV